MNDLVSVIIPVYNVEKYLKKCIESVSGQSYKNLEIIIVDDGSTDNGLKICYEYANNDERITVIHKRNGGLSDARNIGLKHTHGRYIMFVDSDDYIHKDMIKELYGKIVFDNSDIAMCGYKVVDDQGTEKIGQFYVKDKGLIESEEEYWKKAYDTASFYYIVAWNKIYKRELFNKISFPVGKLHEDEYIIHYLVNQCKRISYMDRQLYYYVKRNDSIIGKAYTIKRMDKIDALLSRSSYFINQGYNELADRTMRFCMGAFFTAYKSLDLSSSSEKKEYNNYKRKFKEIYRKRIKNNNCSIITARMKLFCINDGVYFFLDGIFNKIRGKATSYEETSVN